MLEAFTEDSNPFQFLFLKDTNYGILIMALWTILDNPDGTNMKCNYKGRYGQYLVKKFKYRQPYGLKF